MCIGCWCLVVVIAVINNQSLCSLLPIPKLPFFDEEFEPLHFMLQWSWGVVSKWPTSITIEVFETCVIVGDGFKGQYLDCMQLPRPNMEAQTLPRLYFYLVFVFLWVVVVLMNSIDNSVGCGWMQGESRFLGNFLPPRFVLLGDLVLLGIVCRPTLHYWPWMWISNPCQSQSCQRHVSWSATLSSNCTS